MVSRTHGKSLKIVGLFMVLSGKRFNIEIDNATVAILILRVVPI